MSKLSGVLKWAMAMSLSLNVINVRMSKAGRFTGSLDAWNENISSLILVFGLACVNELEGNLKRITKF